VDIRNDPTAKQEQSVPYNYRNCTVLEGSFGLNILQPMPGSNWTDSDDPFPHFDQLVEITGHLRVYKTIKLETLSLILPKLRVIRYVCPVCAYGRRTLCYSGRDPLLNYALAVFRNSDLRDVSLPNLRYIDGGVRIAENDRLCFVDTVDWKEISTKDADVLIEDNYGTHI
jgi:hypothetical protein